MATSCLLFRLVAATSCRCERAFKHIGDDERYVLDDAEGDVCVQPNCNSSNSIGPICCWRHVSYDGPYVGDATAAASLHRRALANTTCSTDFLETEPVIVICLTDNSIFRILSVWL